jgi:nucleotide-binding universal stress UspA family protein
MRTWVVGLDGSREAAAALDWARAEATPDDHVVVVHAWELPLVTGHEAAVMIDPREIEDAARAFVEETVTATADRRVVGRVVRAHPGVALVDAAADADVVVVGHHGSGTASMILGSTAHYVLHHTERPVVVVRGDHLGGVGHPAAHVVVGVDDDADEWGDSPSVRALRWALHLPGVREIDVLHAWFTPGVAVGMYAGAAADLERSERAAAAIVDHVLELAGPLPPGVTVREVSERGTPDVALIEASRLADLVVVGSRGRGGVSELLLGSTSLDLCAHSYAPVVVVR